MANGSCSCREHLAHALKHGHGVLEDLLDGLRADDLDDDDADPDHEERGDRVELDGRDDELREDDEKDDRQDREDRIPLRSGGRVGSLHLGGFGVDVVVLPVIVALHEVVRDAHDDERRNGKDELVLHEVDDRVEVRDLGGEVGGARRWREGHAGGGADDGRGRCGRGAHAENSRYHR